MKKHFIEFMYEVVTDENERKVMQQIYLILVVVSVLVAGLVSLITPNVGRLILFASAAIILVAIVNAVLWSIVRFWIDNYFVDEDRAKSAKK